jgi:hypothetical protein
MCVLVGGGRRECEGWQIWWMHFVFLYENRTMKLVEIVVRTIVSKKDYILMYAYLEGE